VEVTLNDRVKGSGLVGALEVDVDESLLAGFGGTHARLIVVIIGSSSWTELDADGLGMV